MATVAAAAAAAAGTGASAGGSATLVTALASDHQPAGGRPPATNARTWSTAAASRAAPPRATALETGARDAQGATRDAGSQATSRVPKNMTGEWAAADAGAAGPSTGCSAAAAPGNT